jgi:hypothetical protein
MVRLMDLIVAFAQAIVRKDIIVRKVQQVQESIHVEEQMCFVHVDHTFHNLYILDIIQVGILFGVFFFLLFLFSWWK